MHESLQTVRLQVLTISIVPFRTVNRESDNITDGQCYHIVVLIVLFLFALHCHYWNDCSLLFIDYIKSYFWLFDNLSLSCNTRKVCMHAMHFAGFVNVMEKWQITFYTRIQKGLPCGKNHFTQLNEKQSVDDRQREAALCLIASFTDCGLCCPLWP